MSRRFDDAMVAAVFVKNQDVTIAVQETIDFLDFSSSQRTAATVAQVLDRTANRRHQLSVRNVYWFVTVPTHSIQVDSA